MRVRVAKRVESDGVHIIGDYGDLVLWRYFAEIGWFALIVRMVYSTSRFDPGASIASLTILVSGMIEVGFVQILSTGLRCPSAFRYTGEKKQRVLCRLLSTVYSDYFKTSKSASRIFYHSTGSSATTIERNHGYLHRNLKSIERNIQISPFRSVSLSCSNELS